ncbi:A disintegrin and metalloproteinase with thrombospondin motifs 9 [Bombina bombina]|uniref:A disintegrin and metalloproteinase with thrombospondin motifs 9 n=1 Tax=Bombina bombina TaxID=8345 RepID=UPI00235ABAC4|nr:A disintegrin and metalloproteinase with thrombospondin motifs 9 [Bombina bombina]
MHLVFGVVGFIILLQDFLNLASADTRPHKLHPRQAKLLDKLGEYEIVTPTRVNEFGEAFPSNMHFKRKKRSVNSVPGTDPWAPSRTHYKLTAFGQQFLFNLTTNSGFIAPVFTVALFGEPSVNETQFYNEDTSMDHCFYSGYVNTRTDHTAVLSLCAGMLGTFKSQDGDYFVEPLLSDDGNNFEEDHNKPHVVYRHNAPQKNLSREKHICDTKGHKHSHVKHKKSGNQQEKNTMFSHVETLRKRLLQNQYSSYNNNTDNINKTKAPKRTKRFLSYPRYVEVMVVADNRMLEYHGANLQHYVLTLMSIVASIYKDPSIGNLINIAIVKLAVIHNEQEGPSISFNAQTTLKNFCIWQQVQNHPDDSHHSHHDTAVLITRQDICRAHEKCDTLGLAEVGTVCDPYRSCSISEDNGLSTAFTIAHELGHVFNMPHDDSEKCIEGGGKNQQHVMARTLNFNTNPWMWSKCSQKYITQFLDTGYGECLLDEPVSRTYNLLQQLPGVLYNVNKQCELIFGPESKECPYMKMQCRRLWCINKEGPHKGCRTQHTPWADGTECEPGKHCKYGVCIPKERDLRVVDGSWGSWSPFGACSRSCGGGIKTGIRECNKPEPKNGGKYCVGRRMKFKSCNTEPCAKQKKDFREEQCADFDGKHFNINGLPPNVRWVPKYSGILMKDRCKLFCRVAGSTAYYQLRDRVVDGTSCGPDTNDICVQGLCRQAGCDHVLNSKARRDKCGVCGGDNSSCKTIAGTYNIVHYGYNTVVRIPAGATNIDVRQHSYSGNQKTTTTCNYIALSNSQGEFLLNGDFVVSMFKREIKVGNAVIEYSGSDHAVERINCTDRIEQEIVLQILSVGNLYNPDVRFTFNIPIEDKPQQFFWNPYGPWQTCSKLCQGEQKKKPVCTRESDQLVVSDQRCDRISQPTPITEPCNTECELRWHVARKSECTAQCGIGFRLLDIYCAKYIRVEGKTEKVDDRFCSGLQKPSSKEKCTGDCNTGGWRYSAWSDCSKSCGTGTRRRRAMCVNAVNELLDDIKCSQQEKLTEQRCSDFLCPQWKTGDWSDCLVTCGKGHKHRQTWCQFGEERLNDRFCDAESKPVSVQGCQQQECASWQVGPWGQCTATCGSGYQMRAVKCVVGSYMAMVDDNECNAATRPTDAQDCEAAPCPGIPETKQIAHSRTQWRFGSWTPCSSSCGKGTRMRYVSCRDDQGSVADETACSNLPKPSATEVCTVAPCGQWKALEWSSCSVTCGQGKATRQVVCLDYNDHMVDRNECDPEDLPTMEQDCSMSSCHHPNHEYDRPNVDPRIRSQPTLLNRNNGRLQSANGNQWRIGPWGACSSTCAGGFQRRVVVCQDENGYPASHCEERNKPVEQRSCESGPCPQWVFGNWGECSKKCGSGTRTRLVVCQRPNGERFNDLSCEVLEKPPDREQCNTHSCHTKVAWNTGPWSSCSSSCGRGSKSRAVYCVTTEGTHIEHDNCKHLAKPNMQKKCRGGRCPKWKAGEWGKCSVTCGRGIQQRDVRCQVGAQKVLRDSECVQFARPSSEQLCQAANCPVYTWKAESWQECSKTCDEGLRYRKVLCVNEDKKEVPDLNCESIKKPADVENCNLQSCEFIWITGEWSECSVTCGKGYKQRLVSCSEVYSAKDHYEYGYQSSANCHGTQPLNVQSCYLGECPISTSWRVGNWGKCSVTCGAGVMQRSVQCLTNEDQPSNLCAMNQKPEEKKTCYNIHECDLPTNCQDVKIRKSIDEDGEHYIIVNEKVIKVYCAGMQTENPKEYVTLANDVSENFSEVYGYRLHNPTECPYNGSRREDCQCRKDYTAAGFSAFSKVRLDLDTWQIITTDLQFAQTHDGRPVPFATAGDCYSAAKCPQGRFSINLSGTGLLISEATKWISQGNYAVTEIKKSADGTKVTGKCGGYCGKCTPSSTTGLSVQLL